MPDAFDMLGDPVTTDKGTIYDYDASFGEAFGAGFDRQMDANPLALVARQARFFSEDMGSLAGIGERVDQKTAEEEVRRRGLDLKIPKGGITRYELDTLQYLKQREIAQNTVGARARGITGAAAGFAGGVAGSFTDPINIASNFIPFVSEARYASWLARAGASTLARAGVRAGAGAIEGAAGAAVLEPLVYAGATSQQLDYTSTDSFMNVVFGGVMGGGLHPIGGAVYDARVSRAMRGLDQGIGGNDLLRTVAAAAPDQVKREALQSAVAAMERGQPVDVEPRFVEHAARDTAGPTTTLRAYHGSGQQFEEFKLSRGVDVNQAFGHGVYFTNNEKIAESYKRMGERAGGSGTMYAVDIKATPDEMLIWEKPLSEQPAVVQDFVRKNLAGAALSEDTGRGIYYAVKGGASQKTWPKVSAAMREFGIKGVQYEAPRLPSDPERASSNFVIFDPRDVKIVSRNGEPIGQKTPRDLGGLIQQSRADRTQEAFDRQFGDEADEAASRAADDAVTKASEDLQTVAEDVKFLDEQIKGLKSRELWTKADDDAIAQGDEAAKAFEKEASIYRAAAVCMMEG